MKIGIIDADLITRKKHRFPNLACMKISAYYKSNGHDVSLLLSYNEIENYDKVFVSKVFTDTPVPDGIAELSWVECGGTGFFFDKAPPLPDEIEHHFPDYHLYDEFINAYIADYTADADDEEEKQALYHRVRNEFKAFLGYSIGFVTRGCFRKCGFCVNQKYNHVFAHSPLSEFYDPSRPKICLLDDNFFGYSKWREIMEELQATGKPFKFKQGLDERLLTDEKCELLCQAKYDGSITFAFDNIADYRMIEKKLRLLRRYTDKQFTFYVLCGYESQDERDIENVFVRIRLLMMYGCIPYIMRFEKYKDSPHRGIYITLARWCNQPAFFKKKSFWEFCEACGETSASVRYALDFSEKHPVIAAKYFDMKWSDFNEPRN